MCLLMTAASLAGSVVGFAVSAGLYLVIGYILGVAGIVLTVLMFGLGLLPPCLSRSWTNG